MSASDAASPVDLAIAAAIASHSRHPYSRALTAAFGAGASASLVPDLVTEHPGAGLEALVGATTYRLGRAEWALAGAAPESAAVASVVLTKDGRSIAAFDFEDRLRPDARAAVEALARGGLPAAILSGDREAPVRTLAAALGIPHAARVSPGGKAAHIATSLGKGCKPLMVGDGLNDAPALIAAHASMAPASAADVGTQRRDLVFLRESLMAVPQAIDVARKAGRLVRQNMPLPSATTWSRFRSPCMGHVTPLHRGDRHVAVLADGDRKRLASLRSGPGTTRRSLRGRRHFGEPPGGRRGTMTDFLFLVPVAIGLGLAGLAAFMWSFRSGQYRRSRRRCRAHIGG